MRYKFPKVTKPVYVRLIQNYEAILSDTREDHEIARHFQVTTTLIKLIRMGLKPRSIPVDLRRKLTPEQIRQVYRDKRRQHVIAKAYGISQNVVSAIKVGVSHRKITRDLGEAPRFPRGRPKRCH